MVSHSSFPLFRNKSRNWAILLTLLSLISALTTYTVITGSENPLGPDHATVLALVITNLILLLTLFIVIARKLVRLVIQRRQGSVGSRLQSRMVFMFSLVAIIPTIVVAIFSAFFFHYGIQSWFDEQVGTALEDSVNVAESYLKEHQRVIRADSVLMANDLNRQAALIARNPDKLSEILKVIAAFRKVPEAMMFTPDAVITSTSPRLSFEEVMETFTPEVKEQINRGEIAVITDDEDQRVRALMRLERYSDTYLFVSRFVDPKILNFMEASKGSAERYERLKSNISSIQVQLLILFLAVALLLLLAVIFFGIIFAQELVRPISKLVDATEYVKRGDFSVRLEERPEHDEIGVLERAFNAMTGQLARQRDALIATNQKIDERRRFNESVLAGVSAGVLALDAKRIITLANRSALHIFDMRRDQLEGKSFGKIFPEMRSVLEAAELSPNRYIRQEISLVRAHKKYVLMVSVVVEIFSEKLEGYIVTFDDVSELKSAERRAAWSDVARRIAHEIKNPLTPIQLAAERLRRRYAPAKGEPRELFLKYTETIDRHVQEIGSMVESFVSFARMPAPKFADHDLVRLIKDATFSQETSTPGIKIHATLPRKPLMIRIDSSQISRVLGNVLKNAAQSILVRQETQKKRRGEITIELFRRAKEVAIFIRDNGTGFPPEIMDRVTEPYVTGRERGTGLGLAIVKKIIGDHDGRLEIKNLSGKNSTVRGAQISIFLPIQ